MDFFRVSEKEIRVKDVVTGFEIWPDFTVGRSKDLMVRGGSFYAIWDEEAQLWSTDEYDVQKFVDLALEERANTLRSQGYSVQVKYLRSFGSNGWTQFRRFVGNVSDNSHDLDENLTFSNTVTRKTDYVSRRLPYALSPGPIKVWDEIVGTLYSTEERAKIEWAIGAVVSGDSKKIQKFLVLYGPPGAGKGTILNIILKLFVGYTASFEAKALVGNNNGFSTEVFRNNPLVAVQHDGDLSRIEDNTKLNSIVSHEDMTMNVKYKSSYTSRINAFLFMGTNKPVRISDAKSGIIRRLIDAHPTGNLFQPSHYHTLMSQIDFELGAIAHHCLEVYRSMGKNYYSDYQPLQMMLKTDIFFNFVESYFDIFKAQDGATLRQAYALYKEFCNETGIDHVLPQYKFREELRNYFQEFKDRVFMEGAWVRSYYSGFTAAPFKSQAKRNESPFSLVMEETTSIFDLDYAEQPAQLAKEDGTPATRWSNVKTTLADIDTAKLHYVKLPESHIVIDFDLRGDDGSKSLERNLEAASAWPATYAEISKSGAGVHLHYHYSGDSLSLASTYSDGIEIKVFHGDSSLRRMLSKCNNVPIETINSGLPFKEKRMLQTDTVQSEKGLRELIKRNLNKEIHPGTKPSIDFIAHILDEAYKSGMPFDVTDLRGKLVAFANSSTHQPLLCLRTVKNMRFKSDAPVDQTPPPPVSDDRLVIFDVEVYPNLFGVCWSYEDSDVVVKMINPSPQEMEALMQMKLVGFNNRRYDNHMIYARYMGYDNEQLYRLSQKIIEGNVGSMFGEAYRLSYADIYDFSSKKQGLKKFQIELGLRHQEIDIPWDQPVKDEDIPRVMEYCANDVVTTKAVLKDRESDFIARKILADLSGLPVNETTAKHTAKIIFGEDRNPQRSFVYTYLNQEFPGYVYDKGKSTYRGEETGEGGYVYAEPGMYENVALLDVVSMHPSSIRILNLFGEYTKNYNDLVAARVAIKHKDYDTARTLLGGKLAKYLGDPEGAAGLAFALKIVVNIVYGLTSAKFDNPFRDTNNRDNIVAKRGALFMVDLKHAIQEQGYTVAHIKTDSVKIPDADDKIIEFVKNFGAKYGYDFEHEATYDAFCLVNDAVYIARKGNRWDIGDCKADEDNYDACITGKQVEFTAVGAQFQHPYVYKTLFTGEPIEFNDLCETKQVSKGAMYLDFDAEKPMCFPRDGMRFVGRTGRFVPVKEGNQGGILYRVVDGKGYAVTGTKGHFWMEADMASTLPWENIDMAYFQNLAEEARKTIDYFGEFTRFVG